MYKALNPHLLGLSGRQSEIIELALTHGFRGVECDIQEFAKRVQVQGLDKAKRLLESAHLRMSGFELPIRWRSEEATFEAELAKLEPLAGYAAAAGAKVCHTTVLPATDMFPYHENFELHRRRLAVIADLLGRHGIRCGIQFLAAPSHRVDKNFQFIHEANAIVMLVKSVASANLGLVLDTWNWHLGGGNETLLRSLGGDRVVAVRVADAPASISTTEFRDEERIFPQADGVVPNVAILTILRELGFNGPVSVDPHPAALTGMSREAIVQTVSQRLEDLLKAAGVVKFAAKPALSAT